MKIITIIILIHTLATANGVLPFLLLIEFIALLGCCSIAFIQFHNPENKEILNPKQNHHEH